MSDDGSAPQERRGRVLVYDDEAHVRRILGRAISQLGHEAIVAEDAAAARQQLREGNLDLVLAGGDLLTDDTDETKDILESIAEPPDLLMVAPIASHQNAIVGARIGAVDCIEKPITHLRFVREKIKMLLERRFLRVELQAVLGSPST